MKTLLKLIAGTIGVLVLLIAGHMVMFWSSYWSGASIIFGNFSTAFTDGSLYQPQAVVTGGSGGFNIEEIDETRLSERTISDILATTQRWPTAAILVWHDGALQFEHYEPGFSSQTRTESASMNKSVTALMVGAAIEDGFIESVDDPVGRYLSIWQDTPAGEISLRNLLNMSSGLAISSQFAPGTPMSSIYLGQDAVTPLAAVEIGSAPGIAFQYSGINSQALLLAVQQASGRPYAKYLSERLWQRIGAEDAGMWLDHEGGSPRGFCCLFATARSWLKVGLLHLNLGAVDGDQVISRSWLQEITTPSALNPNYGYQTWLGKQHEEKRFYNDITGPLTPHKEPFAVDDMVFFDGAGGQRVYISRKLDLVVVRTGGFATDWDDSQLINAVIRGIEK